MGRLTSGIHVQLEPFQDGGRSSCWDGNVLAHVSAVGPGGRSRKVVAHFLRVSFRVSVF